MFFIGITGGIGSGKSAVMDYLKDHTNCRILLADDLAKNMMESGTFLNDRIRSEFSDMPEVLFEEDGRIKKGLFAKYVIGDEKNRNRLNAIVHPAVKEKILSEAALYREKGNIDFFFLEAALLIEDGYESLCDELWYVYADEQSRRRRLKEERGYDDKRIDDCMKAQLTEEVFLAHCKVVIDNNGTIEETYKQLDRVLKAYG